MSPRIPHPWQTWYICLCAWTYCKGICFSTSALQQVLRTFDGIKQCFSCLTLNFSYLPSKTEGDKSVPDTNPQLTPFAFFQAWELDLGIENGGHPGSSSCATWGGEGGEWSG